VGTATLAAIENQALTGYLRAASTTAQVVGATGNGALLLAAAGVLEGRRAAIHWAYADLLESLGATSARQRWVEDGQFLPSAGGMAGIDMMLALLPRLNTAPAPNWRNCS
jgi:transcriptional regulator GlxA family with amidase domain